ncbi:MAG: hypothetical protein HYT63_00560 [Candidatus Yanofskybacteria bacterium]|nr:hypothetical protein [Candidatus Yanofskybacteria bacterium]
MDNISLFLISILFYFVVSEIFIDCRVLVYNEINEIDLVKILKKLGIIILLCLPVNINGNVFTIMGNAIAEKSVYSVLSFYQKATDGVVFSFFGLGNVQFAKEDTFVFLGLPSYQKAGNAAFVFAGFPLYQEANEIFVAFGGAAIQKSKEFSAVFLGIVGYQNSGKKAETALAMALYQKVQDKDRSFAFFSTLTSPALEKK